MDRDYDIALNLIDEIIPYSLEYYLGVKINDEYDDIEYLDPESEEDSDQENQIDVDN
jgi:nucleosome assembly protein 1-like 1